MQSRCTCNLRGFLLHKEISLVLSLFKDKSYLFYPPLSNKINKERKKKKTTNQTKPKKKERIMLDTLSSTDDRSGRWWVEGKAVKGSRLIVAGPNRERSTLCRCTFSPQFP